MTQANVIDLRPISTNALVTQTKAAWDRADEKEADAQDWYVRVGKLLIQLKKQTKVGEFESALKKIGRSPQRARVLMRIANGKTTIKKERERVREAVRKNRAKTKLRNFARDKDDQDDEDQMTIEERWQNSLSNACGDIIALQSYWKKEFGVWQKFECPPYIQKLVKEAAAELASIAETVTKR